jgi:hypothetical protein
MQYRIKLSNDRKDGIHKIVKKKKKFLIEMIAVIEKLGVRNKKILR